MNTLKSRYKMLAMLLAVAMLMCVPLSANAAELCYLTVKNSTAYAEGVTVDIWWGDEEGNPIYTIEKETVAYIWSKLTGTPEKTGTYSLTTGSTDDYGRGMRGESTFEFEAGVSLESMGGREGAHGGTVQGNEEAWVQFVYNAPDAPPGDTVVGNNPGPYNATVPVHMATDTLNGVTGTLSIESVEQQEGSALVNWAVKFSGETYQAAGTFFYDILANRKDAASGSFPIKEDYDYSNLRTVTGSTRITEDTVFSFNMSMTGQITGNQNENPWVLLRHTPESTGGGMFRSGGGRRIPGQTVTIDAGRVDGYTFDGWTLDVGAYSVDGFALNGTKLTPADPNSIVTTFVMPDGDVRATANWRQGGPGNPEAGKYWVHLVDTGKGADGGGNYRPGETVTIYAGNSTPNISLSGPPDAKLVLPEREFLNWTPREADVTLADANAVTTTFVMPMHNVTIDGNWKIISNN